MTQNTIDKINDWVEMSFLKMQVIGSWFIILFGVGNALRCVFGHYHIFYTVCFCVMGYLGKQMLRISRQELREAHETKKKSANG